MLDFASLSAQMERMLDDESRCAAPFEAIFRATRVLCERAAREGFNGALLGALGQDRVPQNWHPALLLDGESAPDARFFAPAAPANHRVVASDGSQIYADAHQISECYLLHISAISLCYGAQSSAQMTASPHFFWNGMPDDWHEAAAKNGSVVVRELIDARRHIAELDALAQLLENSNDQARNPQSPNFENLNSAQSRAETFSLQNSSAPNFDIEYSKQKNHRDETHSEGAEKPGVVAQNGARENIAVSNGLSNVAVLGMGDGIFDLRVSSQNAWRDWAQSENERVLDRLRNCGQPICGYIAASRATDVVTSLRVLASEWSLETQSATDMARLSDARLFDEWLPARARSAVFVSRRNLPQSSTRNAHAPSADTPNANTQNAHKPGAENASRHQTCFFYLKIEAGNVARIEFPIWVAQNALWLEQIHALTLAQIERGDGYPICLMEAHEHAVVRAAERETFYALLEEMMLRRGISAQTSSKNRSKARPLV